jgi:hypothetical protein
MTDTDRTSQPTTPVRRRLGFLLLALLVFAVGALIQSGAGDNATVGQLGGLAMGLGGLAALGCVLVLAVDLLRS